MGLTRKQERSLKVLQQILNQTFDVEVLNNFAQEADLTKHDCDTLIAIIHCELSSIHEGFRLQELDKLSPEQKTLDNLYLFRDKMNEIKNAVAVAAKAQNTKTLWGRLFSCCGEEKDHEISEVYEIMLERGIYKPSYNPKKNK